MSAGGKRDRKKRFAIFKVDNQSFAWVRLSQEDANLRTARGLHKTPRKKYIRGSGNDIRAYAGGTNEKVAFARMKIIIIVVGAVRP